MIGLAGLLYLFVHLVHGQDEEVVFETKECRERERLVASHREDMYSLVDAVEGQTLILRCRFCNEQHSNQPKNWYKVDELGLSEAREVQLDLTSNAAQNRISVNHKHSLIIKNFSHVDVGFYYCVNFVGQSNDEKFNFLVDLVTLDRNHSVERGLMTDWSIYHDNFFGPVNNLLKISEAPEFVYLREELKIHAELTTQWGSWGPCEACGRPQGDGRMTKTGLCRIKLTPYGNLSMNLTSDERYLLHAPAISCRSLRIFRMFPHIGNYTCNIPNFVLEERCVGSCNPDAEDVNKGWKVGKSTSFKYRKHSVLKNGDHITFICPEASLDNKVVWRRNGKPLKRGDNSFPDVMVDTFDTLYLIKVTSDTAGNYSCYVDDIKMEQIIIYVYTKSKFLTKELLRYLIYLGFILFLSSFCYCAGLVITWRKRHLFKTYSELKEEDPKSDYEEMESFI
ncbi:uncharacterized protein [Euwallacea similis]|uniref:uncharacterized protein n=1 Tax=Euwallacea similis TaxID=1736056 RepID=UPI00344C2CB7